MQCDAEGSAFFNFLQVLSCEWIKVFEEGFPDKGGDPGMMPVAVAPEDLKVFRSCPSRLIALCGMRFLDADDVRLGCKAKKFVVLDVLPDKVVCK